MKKYLILIAIILFALGVAGCKQEATQAPPQQPAPQATPQPTQPPQPTGPPTYVADGQTPVDHINAYFTAYKEQRLEDVFEMAPAENKAKQPKDDFIAARKGMPINDFKVGPTKKAGNKETIEVEYDIGQYGTWVSTWEFEKQGDKWVAVRYLASTK